jgi:hypothetical protein
MRAKQRDERLVILFATDDDADGKPVPLHFSHWSTIENLQVVELHRAKWETVCDFATLKEINPIWSEIDSVLLKASDDELRREQIEGIRQHRFALDEHRLRPYAICETPPFVLAE